MKTRTMIVQAIRSVLSDLGFSEIIPTLLSHAIPTEPTIYPFMVEDYYLATSPESYLKQAMAGGAGDCFAISPAFRNMEGTSQWHQPEFLMAEWYKKDSDWLQQMETLQNVVMSVVRKMGITYPLSIKRWQKLSWPDLWRIHLDADLGDLIDDTKMQEFAVNLGYSIEGATWEQLFNQIALNIIEPHFPEEPFFLTDFPAKLSPLAKPQAEKPFFAERFELLIDRVELANGNTELFDDQTMQNLGIRGMENQLWAGVGFGVDRFAAFLRKTSVAEIQKP